MKERAILIGASTDGIQAISRIVGGLPRDLAAPVFVAQHVGRRSRGYLPSILDNAGPLPAFHPLEGEAIESGRIYVAPPDQHMLVRGRSIHLSGGPEENHCRPAIDALFRSAAIAYGAGAVGIVLTGYLDDGTAGLAAIKDRGGVTIVQDPAEAKVPSMVMSALASVPIDHVATLDEITKLVITLVADDPGDEQPAPSTLALEDAIAGGDGPDHALIGLLVNATPTNLACTDCGRPLFELPDRRLRRFRCTAGHAFTELTATTRATA